MLYIDLKYINLLSPYLRNFRKKSEYLFNFSCPVCGDSQKKKNKARGYLYKNHNTMMFKCHNDGMGMSLGNLIKQVAPNLYSQYVLEKFSENSTGKKPPKETDFGIPRLELKKFSLETLTAIKDLPVGHFARNYVEGRKIPEESFDRIFFTEDYAKSIEHFFPGKYFNLEKEEPRLMLPFFDVERNLMGFQGRSFTADKKKRYLTARANDDVKLVFGAEKLKFNQTIYVVEGPIDSLFIPNCVAVASSDLLSVENRIENINDVVYIFDNEPRHKELIGLMEGAINLGKKILIWPVTMKEKDINEMILTGRSKEDIMEIVKNRTYDGITARMKFLEWKKC